MRPTKSRIFCPECQRMKTVFDSEKAALKFIEYNSEEITAEGGYAPTRAYYCDLCCGWHITSHKAFHHKTKRREMLDHYMEKEREKKELKAQQKAKKANKTVNSPLVPFLTEAMKLTQGAIESFQSGDTDSARQLIEKAVDLIEKMTIVKGSKRTRKQFQYWAFRLNRFLHLESQEDMDEFNYVVKMLKELRESHIEHFNYDPDAKGAIIYELMPDNIDAVIEQIKQEELRKEEEKAEQRRQKEIEQIMQQRANSPKLQALDRLELAHDEILLKDYDLARKHLLEAITHIENVQSKKVQRKLTRQLSEIMSLLPDLD